MPHNFTDEVGAPYRSLPQTGEWIPDKVLVAPAKEGDQRAFETLVNRYQACMFTIALRHTRVREDAEDVVQ